MSNGICDSWCLPPLREGVPASNKLRDRRSKIVALEQIQIMDPSAELRWTDFDGIRCLSVVPPRPSGLLLYFHGGGFRMGRPQQVAGLASRIATRSGFQLVIPEYGLAPERPYPHALHDSARVFDALPDGMPLVVGGDSAGGNLAAALVVAAALSEKRPVSGLVMLSPWLDLMANAHSFTSAASSDTMFSQQAAVEAAQIYLGDTTRDDPLASPLFADAGLFPPSWLCASASEVLLDDSLKFANRLAGAGQQVDLHIMPAQKHVWPVMAPDHPDTEYVIGSIAQFLTDKVGRSQLLDG